MIKYKAKDYQRQLFQLQPPGLAWNWRPESNLGQFYLAEGEALARAEGEAWRLIDEANPLYTFEALEDWERVLALPDECSALGNTFEIRRGDVIAKLNHPVGQSKQYYIGYMAHFDFTIEITDQWPPFLADEGCAGDYLWEAPAGVMVDAAGNTWRDYYNGWNFVWEAALVNRLYYRAKAGKAAAGVFLDWWYMVGEQCVWFSADLSQADDYLLECHNPNLECRLNKIKPAHTNLIFLYKTLEAN